MNLYERALIFAVKAHGDQKRKYTGEPYIVHPIRVAAMVSKAELYVHTAETVAAALLHDVLEDTGTSYADLEREFERYIADVVAEISDVSKPTDGNRAARKALDLAHLAKASRNAQTIKVCDIIDNARSVVECDPSFARIYIPEKRAQLAVLTDADPNLLNAARRLLA
jgi:(p)ppGpp synthase/HD superfamily hydrolase